METTNADAAEVAVRFGFQLAYGPWEGNQDDWRNYRYCRECGAKGLKILEVAHLPGCKVGRLVKGEG